MTNLHKPTLIRLVTGALAGLALCSIWTTPAGAQVHVDPGGPAGKQYSDSLNEARAQNGGADPATAVPGSGAGEPPLFGAGVTPPSGGDGGGSGDGAGGGSAGSSSTSASAPDDGGSPGALIAIVAAVVALGGLAGVGVAGLSRGQSA